MMDILPEEIILRIFSFLEPSEIAGLQTISRRFSSLARDNLLWKTVCFENDHIELRREKGPLNLFRIAKIRLPPTRWDGSALRVARYRNLMLNRYELIAEDRFGALANWDPSYPEEKTNFYYEYVQRHVSPTTLWFEPASRQKGKKGYGTALEATGAGVIINSDGIADKLVAPLDDGGICIWDVFESSSSATKSSSRGRIRAMSAAGLLSPYGSDVSPAKKLSKSKAMMTETGATECVSVDSGTLKGFFAVQDVLNEVDLKTLQVVSRTRYPSSIFSLSQAKDCNPLTVGATQTLHLHDTRAGAPQYDPDCSTSCDKLGASSSTPSRDYAILSEPGPLSILHHDGYGLGNDGEIWVAGRFTSLLNYDRRHFPRLRGTIHSGAQLSCITSLPYPHIHRTRSYERDTSLSATEMRAMKSAPGWTLVAAGKYKGTGSLELYGLSPNPNAPCVGTGPQGLLNETSFQNRLTAAGSKIFSVAPHGTRLVYSDGNGYLRWVERDGFMPVNSVVLTDVENKAKNLTNLVSDADRYKADIAKKIIPTVAPWSGSTTHRLDQDGLIIWTSEGWLGMVGFGAAFSARPDGLEEEVVSAEEAELMQEARDYEQTMRRAFERQADELTFMRGLGLGA